MKCSVFYSFQCNKNKNLTLYPVCIKVPSIKTAFQVIKREQKISSNKSCASEEQLSHISYGNPRLLMREICIKIDRLLLVEETFKKIKPVLEGKKQQQLQAFNRHLGNKAVQTNRIFVLKLLFIWGSKGPTRFLFSKKRFTDGNKKEEQSVPTKFILEGSPGLREPTLVMCTKLLDPVPGVKMP